MPMRWLPILVSSCVLVAQDPGKKWPEGAEPASPAAKAPPTQRRFTEFPVPDVPPLDVAAATSQAIVAMLALQEGEGVDQWPYQGVYREDENPDRKSVV